EPGPPPRSLHPDRHVRHHEPAHGQHQPGQRGQGQRWAQAGGAGVDGALTDAAAVGEGWAFGQLTRALTVARVTRTTPWARLRQLGEELDVPELSELAASVSLAGTEGAKVRASLAAKASALRVRELTDAEGHAQAATERMSLPVVVLFAAFLVFIGYPALSTVLNGL
ncbi:MAG TPA: hypothetical protein VMU51_27330, partial [Mycobacteriales bacterium]|nr:hypothetical protein [Mycobacteriales bacterium]